MSSRKARRAQQQKHLGDEQQRIQTKTKQPDTDNRNEKFDDDDNSNNFADDDLKNSSNTKNQDSAFAGENKGEFDQVDNIDIEGGDGKQESAVEENDSKASSKKKLTKKEIRDLKKLRKQGKITEEQRALLNPELILKPTIDDKEARIQREQTESAVTGLQQQKGVVDSMSKDIHIQKFSLAIHGKVLFADADLHLAYGRKYGLVGPNGSGKSTLLRHISQRHLPIPQHIRILHVEQEVEGTDQKAIDAVLAADTERTALLEEERKLKPLSVENTDEGLAANERLIEIYNRLKAIGAYSAEHRASAILAGLQFSQEMMQMPTKQFSGGWRMRIALARALFVNPDLLLLDEPTNHLDLNAVIWLEAYLKKWKKTLLVVSHDRDFLNWVVTDIIHLHKLQLHYYKGDYDTYEKTFLDASRLHEKKLKEQEKKTKLLNEKQTQAAKEKKKKMEKDGLLQKDKKVYKVKFTFEDPGPLSIPVIQIKDVSFGYSPDKLLFKNLELNIDLKSRIAIVGPNGVGKSTLINLIMGELEPTSGEIIRNRKLRMCKFAQHFVDQLVMTDTPIEYLKKKIPPSQKDEIKEQDLRNYLGKFGIKDKEPLQPIQLLSGGQKSRIVLASIAMQLPHILFLDEPTNHLDIQSVDALAKALQEFKGAVVLISHDQRLITTVCNELWVVGNQKVTIYNGTFDDYRQELIDQMPDDLFEDEDTTDNAKTQSKK
jgi:ATP-binding cassette subfamily F protein 1